MDSCNSRVKHSQSWCSMTIYFSNCPRRIVQSGSCVEDEGHGQCINIAIKGNINKIDMYQGYWKGFKD